MIRDPRPLRRGAAVLALAAAALAARPSAAAPTPRLLLLRIDMNNLSSYPDDPPPRLAALEAALRDRLAGCGYEVPPPDSAAERRANAGNGYFYAHPDEAARLGRELGATYVLVPRLNRASSYVTDLQLHVVRAADGMVVSNRAVELKGFGMTAPVTAHLTVRGAAWMADQVSQAVEWAAAGSGAVPARRCRA